MANYICVHSNVYMYANLNSLHYIFCQVVLNKTVDIIYNIAIFLCSLYIDCSWLPL